MRIDRDILKTLKQWQVLWLYRWFVHGKWGTESSFSASQMSEKYGKMLQGYTKNMFRSLQSLRMFGEVLSAMAWQQGSAVWKWVRKIRKIVWHGLWISYFWYGGGFGAQPQLSAGVGFGAMPHALCRSRGSRGWPLGGSIICWNFNNRFQHPSGQCWGINIVSQQPSGHCLLMTGQCLIIVW